MPLPKWKTQFKAAYEKEFGNVWNWDAKDEDGEPLHPAICGDPRVEYFYRGFRMALPDRAELRRVEKELEIMERRIREMGKIL